jgi:hypothetical protein
MDNELKPTVLNQMTTLYVLYYKRRNIEKYYNTLALLPHSKVNGTAHTVCTPGQPYVIVFYIQKQVWAYQRRPNKVSSVKAATSTIMTGISSKVGRVLVFACCLQYTTSNIHQLI